jgi:hypothetical protein
MALSEMDAEAQYLVSAGLAANERDAKAMAQGCCCLCWNESGGMVGAAIVLSVGFTLFGLMSCYLSQTISMYAAAREYVRVRVSLIVARCLPARARRSVPLRSVSVGAATVVGLYAFGMLRRVMWRPQMPRRFAIVVAVTVLAVGLCGATLPLIDQAFGTAALSAFSGALCLALTPFRCRVQRRPSLRPLHRSMRCLPTAALSSTTASCAPGDRPTLGVRDTTRMH